MLVFAFRHVVADAIAGDMSARPLFADIACARTDHDRELHLPIRLFRALGDHDVVIRTNDAGGRFGEQHRLFWNGHAGFGRVVGIVEPDGDKIADSPETGPDPGRAAHRGQGLWFELGQTRQHARSERVGVDVRHHFAQIPQFSGAVDEGRFLLARPAVSYEFHNPSGFKAAPRRPGIPVAPAGGPISS